MYRNLFRFTVMTLTILTVNLITNAISNYLISYRNSYKPLAFTFAGMAVTVVILYPLFIKLESWVKAISMKTVRSGKSLAGKYLGLLLVFSVGIIILAYFYARMWYHVNIFKLVISGGN